MLRLRPKARNESGSEPPALQPSAQIISYEIPLGLSILGVVLMTGSLNLEQIIWSQATGHWFILFQPLAFVIFMTSAFAECNRLPFDLPECEQELIGGYHTEYNAMKLAFFFLGEYTHMITTSFLMVILFFGGWHGPWEPLGPLWFLLKVFVVLFIFIWMRAALPRLRYDQLMRFGWKVLLPVATLNAFVTALVVVAVD